MYIYSTLYSPIDLVHATFNSEEKKRDNFKYNTDSLRLRHNIK